MKKGFLRAAGIVSIVLLPAWAQAENDPKGTESKIETLVAEPATAMAFDGTRDERWQDEKKSKRKKGDDDKPGKKEDVKKGDIKKDGKKPEIKEVPRSIPKLKPKTVTDKIKIKRLPVKVKPKGLLRVL